VHPADVIVLNGVPRSGKSSIARALMERDGVWANVGVDVPQAATPPNLQPGMGLRAFERAAAVGQT
jgi:chloramphenicol 3-O phosphotransferase